MTLDGNLIGGWNKASADTVRESLPVRPSALRQHAWFAELIWQRIRMEIHYESLYGGEEFTALLNATN